MRGRFLFGTSGYDYPHWRDAFYPHDLPHAGRLPFYAERYPAVEVNATFYRLQSEETFRHWHDSTPADFRFVLKGSRYITHIKRLRDPSEPLRTFFDSARPLKSKLECVLWQLRPDMRADPGRLEAFCSALAATAPPGVRNAFEFRGQDWFSEPVYAVLRSHGCALTIAHSSRWPRAEVLTADWTYLRFHGGEEVYGSAYSDGELKYWSRRARSWLAEGMDVYAFFNNDAHGHAVRDAARMAAMTTGKDTVASRSADRRSITWT